jgi:hypothetical protein
MQKFRVGQKFKLNNSNGIIDAFNVDFENEEGTIKILAVSPRKGTMAYNLNGDYDTDDIIEYWYFCEIVYKDIVGYDALTEYELEDYLLIDDNLNRRVE